MERVQTFIPRDLFPAVMFARKMMRDGEDVRLACYKAAKYYDVETSDVASWLRGKRVFGKKEYFFAFVIYVSTEATGEFNVFGGKVVKSLQKKEAERKIDRYCTRETAHHDTGSCWSMYFTWEELPEKYQTEKQAQKALEKFIENKEEK